MKNKFYTFLILVVLFSMFLMVFIFSKDVANSVLFSISIWKDNLLPSLFPFFILSDLLMEYGFIELISFFFGRIMLNLFHLRKETGFALVTSMISGFPSGGKFTKILLDKNVITLDEANHLIMFTHYSNPIFVVFTIGVFLLNNKKIGFIILLCHIISNFIIGIIFRRKKQYFNKKESIFDILENITDKRLKGKKFITILINSIINTFKILVNMLGIIIFFLIITTLLKKFFVFSPFFNAIFSGIIEMTQGIIFLSKLNISIQLKASIIGALISFGGISVHFQVKSIIDGTKICYKNFLIARIIHAILCFVFIYIFLSWFMY